MQVQMNVQTRYPRKTRDRTPQKNIKKFAKEEVEVGDVLEDQRE